MKSRPSTNTKSGNWWTYHQDAHPLRTDGATLRSAIRTIALFVSKHDLSPKDIVKSMASTTTKPTLRSHGTTPSDSCYRSLHVLILKSIRLTLKQPTCTASLKKKSIWINPKVSSKKDLNIKCVDY